MSFDFDRYYREVDETLRKHGVPVEPMQMEINPEPETPEPQVTPEEQYNHVEAPAWKDVSILQSPLREVAGSVYNIVEGRAPHNEQLQAAAKDAMEDVDIEAINPEAPEENPGVDPEIQAQNEQGHFTPFKAAIEETAEDKNAFFSEQASAIRASSVYREYFYTQPEKLAQARKMAAATGITVDSFINDPKAYTEVQHIYDELKKGQAVVGEKNFSMKNIYAMYPELNGIADMDDEQITLALHDINNVHRVSGIIENAKVMWEQGKKQTELNKRYYKIYKGTASKQEEEETEAMYREMNNPLNVKMAPYFMEHPFEYAVATAAQSLPMMLEDTKGSIIGGAAVATLATGAAILATAATGGTMTIPAMTAAASFGWKAGSFIGGTGALTEMSIGEAYAEKKHKTDQDGKPLYTHEEIKPIATAEGMINAILEHSGYGTVRGAFTSKSAIQKKAMQVKTEVLFEQAKASANLRSTFDKLIKERFGTFTKATLEESGEEAMQSFNTDIMNNILVYNTGKGEYVSTYDMARNAKNSYLESLPASAAMTGASAGAGAMTSAPAIGRQLAHASAIGQYNEQSQQTFVGMDLLANLQAAVADSKLKDLAPDVQQKIIRHAAKDTDFKLVYIDTESALQKETGRDSLQKVAAAAGYDSDTLQTAIEQGNLIVPLEVYAQSEADPDLLSSVSFSKEAPSIEQMKREVKENFARQQEMMKETIDRQKKIMDQFIKEYFPNDKEGADMAVSAIYENAENPAQGLKAIEKRLIAERDAILQPAIDAITKGGDENWRKNYREIFGKNPNEKVLRSMAEDLIYRSDNAPQIEGWSIDPEASTDARDKLAAINHRLAIIDRTKEKISTMTKAEIKLTEGMTPEAFSVYRTLFSELSKGPGTSSRAARMNAILFARHADNFARVISEKTGRKYTAKDYYQERFALGFNGQHGELNQKSNGHYGIKSEYITDFSDDVTRDDVEKALLELADKNLHNYIEDEDAKVNSRQRKKLTSAKASGKTVDNGFSVNDHFSIAKQIESVWNHAALVMDSPDEKNGHVDVRMRRYVAAIRKGTTPAFAWLTVKSTGDGLRIYSVELMDEKMLRSTLANAPQKYSADGPIRSFEGIISRLGGNVNAFNQIIGENGAAELDRQEEVTTRLDNLAVARQMEEAGKDALTIKLATGWERGADNLWKYEADDTDAVVSFDGDISRRMNDKKYQRWLELNQQLNDDFSIMDSDEYIQLEELYGNYVLQMQEAIEEGRATLEDVLHYPELYKAYQQLKKVRFEIQELDGSYGYYSPLENTIVIDRNYINDSFPPSLRRALLHEVQHAIQNIEGFAEGADPNMFSDMESLSQEIQFQKEIIREAEEVIEQAEDLGYTEETISNGRTVAEWRILKTEAEAIIAKVEAAQKNYISPEEKYQRSAGEVEARNVQHRMGMSWEDRQKTLLKDTEDVAREDQIFLRYGGVSMADERTAQGKRATKLSELKAIPVVVNSMRAPDPKRAITYTVEEFRKVFPRSVYVETPIGTVTINAGGIRDSLNHTLYQAKMDTVLTLPLGMEKAVYLETLKDFDGKDRDNHFFAYLIDYDGQERYVLCRVIKEGPDSKPRAYVHDIYSVKQIEDWAKKISSPLQTQPQSAKQTTEPRGAALYKTIIARHLDKVNNNKNISETYFQSAWHGTPHDFDTFDLGAIGTGEGAQAHGWGLYFAADKGVSEEYRARLAKHDWPSVDVVLGGIEYRISTKNNTIERKDGTPLNSAEKALKNLGLINWIFNHFTKNPSDKDAKEPINKFLENIKGDKENGYRSGDKLLAGATKAAEESLSTPAHPADAELVERVMNIYKVATNHFDKIVDHIDEYNSEVESGLKELLGERKANAYTKKMHKKGLDSLSIALWYEKSRNISNAIDFLEGVDITEAPATVTKPGTLFEVDIPDDSVMLNESLTYEEQPEAVQMDLWGFTTALFPGDEFGGKTGREIYEILSSRYGGDKAASLALNNAGIKGIKYDGYIDGTCYVVFDDKAISVINKFNQGIKGSTTPLSNGQRLVQLFETADESTFLHEMGHIFLLDLEDLAKIDDVSAAEFAKVKDWAQWHKGDARKFRNTPWTKEFSELEKSIVAAEEAGDFDVAESQKRRWMHERFARGFELYLRDGKAPAKGLKAVFRKFADFLRQVYTAFVSDGARASAEVEAIMARMIATDEEIEAMAMDDQFKDIEKAGGEKLLNETERETYERWMSEAKAEAKEKLYKVVMADLAKHQSEEYQKLLKEEEAKILNELEQEPIYLARAIVGKMGGDREQAIPVILDHCFADREAFDAADKAAPTIEQATKQRLDEWKRSYDEQNKKEITEEEVREAMETSVYHRKAKAMETAAMARKLDSQRKITGKVDQAIKGVNDALDALPDDTDLTVDKLDKRVRLLMNKINALRFSTKWNSDDFKRLDRMLKSSTKEEMAELLSNFVDNMQQQKLNINEVEKANEGRLRMYANMAKEATEKQSIFNATNSGNHRKNQRKAERRVLQMIAAGRFELALQQSQQAALSAAMAQESEKAKEEVDKLIAHINRQLNARSVKLPAKERYWHKHIAYLLGIGLYDANKPVLPEGQQLGTLQDLLNGYKDRLDLTDDYNADEVMEFITGTAAQQSYVALTVGQLRQAVQLLDIIYKCGKDEFELKTVKGVTIASVVDDILKDEVAIARKMHIKKRRIQDNIGGLGYNGWLAKIPTVGDALAKAGQNYLVIGLKPEKVIELLGKTAYKYIFGTFDEAASREADMMAQATIDVQNLLKDYSYQECRDWKKRTYKLQLPGEEVELTKENIICMALNLGTDINRQRLIGGLLGSEYDKENGMDTSNLFKFIEDNMTKKDWLLVQGVWDYLHTYWEDTVRVEQDLNGMQLQAQTPVPFPVIVDGEKLDMAGGYYPIVYNPDKNDRSSVQAQDDVAKQMGGSAKVLGTGRSHTKSRTEAEVFRELQLTFDIIPKHLNQVIHNITTRIAARDVYRLLNHKELSQHITDRLGSPVLDMLRKWALDVWTQLPEKDMAANVLEKALGALRRNSTFAIMAYRTWPAIENSSGYAVLADKLGAVNALSAMSDFYGNIEEHRLLLNKSSIMRNRLNNLDRDIKSQTGLFNADHPAVEILREHGYDLMIYSDLMFSAPLWCRAYKDVFHETLEEVNNENIVNKTKVQEAQNKLDKLRGEHIQTDEDIKEWYAERRNRANAGQVGWQPGTSRFAVMGHQEFTEQLEDLKNRKDELGLKIWEAEAEFGRAMELKILDDAEVVREAEHRAAMKADAVIRDAFGSGRTVDLPAVQRSYSELVKAMTTFYSFFNTVFNSIYFSYIQSRYGNRPAPNAGTWEHVKQWSPLARTVMYRIFLLSAIGSVLKMATKTDGDDDRDKYRKVMKDGKEVKEEIPWLQRFLKVFAKNSLGTATGALYGVRDIANVAMNLAFDGTDFGRGINIVSTPLRSIEEGMRTIKLIAAKSERDAKIEARKQQEAAKLKKMNPRQRKKWLADQKYKQPIKRITYEEIFRHAANALTGFTAAKTGLSSTIIDSVTGTMQYLLDTDNRYDANWRNIIWSAIFDKKPVEKTPPEKPAKKPKSKKRHQ